MVGFAADFSQAMFEIELLVTAGELARADQFRGLRINGPVMSSMAGCRSASVKRSLTTRYPSSWKKAVWDLVRPRGDCGGAINFSRVSKGCDILCPIRLAGKCAA